MLAKLLALLLQSKAAAISAVLLVGTTGALVSASTQNGVTTITVTQESPSASPDTDVTNKTSEHDNDKDEDAKCDTSALRDAVHAVNSTFSKDHTALMHMRRDERGSAATRIVESTDKLLKQIREAAVQAIHATNTCAKQEDQDKDENDSDKDEDHATTGTTSNTVTFTATDAKGIADEATNLMTLAFNDAKAKLAALPASPKGKSDQDETHHTTTERPESHD